MDLLWLMASVHASFAQCFQVCSEAVYHAQRKHFISCQLEGRVGWAEAQEKMFQECAPSNLPLPRWVSTLKVTTTSQ